ncbi:MAG: depupylase/deamidase Dop [Actinomycetota bacterium]
MRARVIGTEVEYGITITNDDTFNPVTASALVVNSYGDGTDKVRWSYVDESPGRDARGFSLADTPIDETDSGLVNAVLDNGARLYVDHAHPEYSSPECSDPLSATLYDKAGEVVMHRAALSASRLIGEGRTLVLHKNNSDGKGNSYGAHENYLVDRQVPFSDIVHHLTAFLVSRQFLTGSGKLGAEHGRDATDFQITQRADFFEEEIGLETTLKRPIINTRDEPHADPALYRRLHVIFGDATLSEIQTFVKVGSTSLLLMALEDQALGQPIRLRSPVAAVRTVSRDLGLTRSLELRDGTRSSALELQWRYLTLARDYANTTDISPSYKRVIAEWESLLLDLEGGYERVADRLDWAAKLSIMEAYRARDGLGWTDPKLQLLDLQFHDIAPDRGLYHRLVRSGRMRRLFSDDQVERAVERPPEGTRAWFRGETLRRYRSSVVAANWDSLVFDTGESNLVRVPMMDPLRGTRSLVEGLLDESPDASTLISKLGGESD